MAIQWKDPEIKDRLLAAIIAAAGTINMNEVARLFGRGATYDAVEGQLRKAKKQARELKEEAGGRSGPAEPVSKATKIKGVSSSPAKSPVKGARVTKPRKAVTSKIKAEFLEEDNMLLETVGSGTGDDETEV